MVEQIRNKGFGQNSEITCVQIAQSASTCVHIFMEVPSSNVASEEIRRGTTALERIDKFMKRGDLGEAVEMVASEGGDFRS